MRKSVENKRTSETTSVKPRRFAGRRKRALLLVGVVAALIAATAAGIGGYYYTGNAALLKQKAESNAKLANLDKAIVRLKAERLAREKAEKEAAEKKAAEEAAAAAAAATTVPTLNTAQSASCNRSTSHNNPASIDVIVNKKHCIVPLGYAPGDLVTAYGATLASEAAGKFAAMVETAAAQGVAISASSSFRSYSAQVATYNYWVSVNGSAAAADQVSARPGYSEHQTGLAVDVSSNGCSLECFAGTSAYSWMQAHAHEFGFVERYPAGYEAVTGYSPEAWHYRYVGASVASDMKARGVKALEQYWGFEGGSY